MKNHRGRNDYKGSKASRVEFLPSRGDKGLPPCSYPKRGSVGSKASSIDSPILKGNKGISLGKPVVRSLKSKTSDERLGD